MSLSTNGKQTSPTALLMSGGRTKSLRKAPMERHYSDLSWRISALTSNQIPPHKSESSNCVNQLSHSGLKSRKIVPKIMHTMSYNKTRKKDHFGWTMHCLHQRLKSMFLEFFSSGGVSSKGIRSEEKISKNIHFSL